MAWITQDDNEFGSSLGGAFCCGFIIAVIVIAMALNDEKEASGGETFSVAPSATIQ